MNCSELNFKIKTASCETIIDHLIKCANCFNPPLYTYVDIKEYGKKIFDNAVTFEGWDDNKLVGIIAAYYNNWETKNGYITNVSVLKGYKGFGIASKLLKQTINYGRENGFYQIELEVNINNIKAFKLYEKHGFVVVKQNTKSYWLLYRIC